MTASPLDCYSCGSLSLQFARRNRVFWNSVSTHNTQTELKLVLICLSLVLNVPEANDTVLPTPGTPEYGQQWAMNAQACYLTNYLTCGWNKREEEFPEQGNKVHDVVPTGGQLFLVVIFSTTIIPCKK